MKDVFISYNNEDRLRAQMFAQALEGRGWSIFWDRVIPTGKTWRDTIGKELNEARCVIVLWSKTSIESDWVREEADDAKARRVLVPVRIDNIQPPIGFRGIPDSGPRELGRDRTDARIRQVDCGYRGAYRAGLRRGHRTP